MKGAFIEWVSIDLIRPNPENPNKHSKVQVERLAKLIKAYGWRHPLILNIKNAQIVVGHCRYEAAKFMGLKEVPVHYQEFASDDEAYGFMVADNGISDFSELDFSEINKKLQDLDPSFDLELLGLKDFVLEPADKYGDKDADAIPEVKEVFVKTGDVWTLGRHRLVCSDSTDADQVAVLMNGEKADMVYTDPPYGINFDSVSIGTLKGKKYNNNLGKIQNDHDTTAAKRCFETLDPDVRKVIWGANYFTDFLPVNGAWIVWVKHRNKDPKTNNFSAAELAWTNYDRVAVKVYDFMWDAAFREGSKKDELESRVHPNQKPVGVTVQILEGANIFDPFLGSGSTLIACEKTNRKCFGMEIDPQYCQIIIDRFEKFTGKKAIQIGGYNGNKTEAFIASKAQIKEA